MPKAPRCDSHCNGSRDRTRFPLNAISPIESWRRRLYLPNYHVGEAAKYAGISTRTVADWHKVGGRKSVTLSPKESGEALSYMQLIEVAVVAAIRKAGVTLKRIRDAREYVSKQLQSEFPFAEFRFKTDGRRLWMDYEQIEGEQGKGKLLGVDQGGQFAWEAVIGRLHQFEYEDRGIAVRWHLLGQKSPIVIDPRIAFGAPAVKGTPTWAVKGRWKAGESIADISADFGLKKSDVLEALNFEGVSVN